jgi:hypothetical protein
MLWLLETKKWLAWFWGHDRPCSLEIPKDQLIVHQRMLSRSTGHAAVERLFIACLLEGHIQ